jgi:hypothetical protein
MFLTIQDLKVDQTVLPSDGVGIFVTNVNIPESVVGNLDNILERIRLLVVNDYDNIENIQYQVCATYELRNTVTGDRRQWSGSFNPRGNQSNSLSQFQVFGPDFIGVVKNACSPDNVLRQLRFHHAQTNWVFHKITSFIVTFQSEINLSHPTLLRRSLLLRRHGNRHRSITSFLLP